MTTDAQQALAAAYKLWMKQNDLSQQNPHDFAKSTGRQGPWNSQLSLLCQAKLQPKPQFFCSLAAFNAAIAAKDFAGVTNRALLDKLKACVPMLDDQGKVIDAAGFFSMYVGLAPIPEAYAASAHTYTEEDAKAESIRLRDAFRAFAQNEMLSPADAWSKVVAATDLAPRHQARLKEVLSGWGDLSADEMTEGLLVAACSVFTAT